MSQVILYNFLEGWKQQTLFDISESAINDLKKKGKVLMVIRLDGDEDKKVFTIEGYDFTVTFVRREVFSVDMIGDRVALNVWNHPDGDFVCISNVLEKEAGGYKEYFLKQIMERAIVDKKVGMKDSGVAIVLVNGEIIGNNKKLVELGGNLFELFMCGMRSLAREEKGQAMVNEWKIRNFKHIYFAVDWDKYEYYRECIRSGDYWGEIDTMMVTEHEDMQAQYFMRRLKDVVVIDDDEEVDNEPKSKSIIPSMNEVYGFATSSRHWGR